MARLVPEVAMRWAEGAAWLDKEVLDRVYGGP